MAKHVWTVLCRRGIVDQFDNTVSIFDTIENLKIETSKELPPSDSWSPIPYDVTLVTFIVRSDEAIPEKVRLKIDAISPNGNVYDGAPMIVAVDLTEFLKCRNFTRMKSVPIMGAGKHWFSISLEQDDGSWRIATQLPLDVEITEATQTVTTQDGEAGTRKRKKPVKTTVNDS